MTKKNKKKKYKLNVEKIVALILILAMVVTSILAIFG